MAIDTTEANLYGTGRGDAQVWGQNKALGMLQQQYQQDQLRRQKEDAEIADQVSKINYDAARNEDLPEILNQYKGIKNTFAKIRGTTDQMERIKLQAELNQQKALFSRDLNLSKQAGQQLGELGKLRLTHGNEISDEFTPNYKKLSSLSVFDPQFKALAESTAATAILPKYDELTTMKKLADASIKKLPESEIRSQNVGGGTSYYTESGQTLDRDAFGANVATELMRNRGMMNQVKNMYPDLSIADAVKAYTDEKYNGIKGAYEERKRTGASVVKPDNTLRNMEYQDALIRKRAADGVSGGGDSGTNYRQKTIKGLLDRDKDWIGRVESTLLPGAKIQYRKGKNSDKKYIFIETPLSKDGMSGGDKINIDISDPNAATKLNTYLSVATGEKISPSKGGIVGGKRTGEVFEPTVRKEVKPEKKVSVKGTNKRLY